MEANNDSQLAKGNATSIPGKVEKASSSNEIFEIGQWIIRATNIRYHKQLITNKSVRYQTSSFDRDVSFTKK